MVEPQVADFYGRALHILHDAQLPFVLGGTFALAHLTGICRATADLDLFIRRSDYPRIAQVLHAQAGWHSTLTHPHWLAKVHEQGEGGEGAAFIDLIFNSGNGLAPVDDDWFEGNARVELLGVTVPVMRAEDALMSKAFIMERERYDGGDVAHLLQACAERLDWRRVLARFGPHWRVLLAHLTLFGYIYPGERQHVPTWVMAQLLDRLREEQHEPPPAELPVCAGTLLSRAQYLHDVGHGYVDGRLTSTSTMTQKDVEAWTQAMADLQEADEPAPPVSRPPHAPGQRERGARWPSRLAPKSPA